MQSENKNGGVQFPSRYWAYELAKRHLGGFRGRQVFPIGGTNTENNKQPREQSISVQEFQPGEQPKEVQINNATMAGPRITERGYTGTLDNCGGQGVMKDCKIRRLTPTECERLMGLPDGWTEGVSDTQRYKLCGNGLVPQIVTEIVKKLII